MDAEYIFFNHFMGRVDEKKHQRICEHLLAVQAEDGAWPLFYKGPGHLGNTIEAYFALSSPAMPLTTRPWSGRVSLSLRKGGWPKPRSSPSYFSPTSGSSLGGGSRPYRLRWCSCRHGFPSTFTRCRVGPGARSCRSVSPWPSGLPFLSPLLAA